MSFLREALAAALESADNELPDGVSPEENLSEALMETEDAAQEAEEAEDVVDELEDAVDSTEAIVSALESHVADGGMTPQTALSHNVAMENVLRKLPLDVNRFTVSSESFGGTQERLVASQEALEGAKALLQKLWDGLKNAWTKAWNAVKTFFATIGKSAKALKAGAADLKNKAGSSGKSLKEGVSKIEVPAALVTGSSDANVYNGLNAIVKKGNELGGGIKAVTDKVGRIANFIGKGKISDEGLEEHLKKIAESASLDGLPGQDKNGKATEISVPGVNEAGNIAQGVTQIADYLSKFSEKEYKEMEKAMQATISKVDAEVKKADAENATSMRQQLTALNKASTELRKASTGFNSYAAKTAKNALSFGYKILKQYA